MVLGPEAGPKESVRGPEAGLKGNVTAPAADPNQNEIALAAALKEGERGPAAGLRASVLVAVLKEGENSLREREMGLERGRVTDHIVRLRRKDHERDHAVSQRGIGRDLEGDPEVSPKGNTIVPGVVPEAAQLQSGKGLPTVAPDPLPHKKMGRKIPDPGPNPQWQPLLAERVQHLLLHSQPLLPVPGLAPAPQNSLPCEGG